MDEKILELLTERFVNRINKANKVFLVSIGEIIKKLGEIRPTEAHRLIQMLRYGDNFTRIEREIARILSVNINEVDAIFSEYAKKDQQFYKQFYQYKNIPFTPYAQNNALKRQVQSLANITKGEMMKYSRTKAIGYSIVDPYSGHAKFFDIKETYNKVLDEAFINIGQGKENFDSGMRNIMKQLGGSGLKTVDYVSGRHVRLDSTVRMHLMNDLTVLHNENQKLFGEEFGADGVEISVHETPAPDHASSQGRQFSNEEYQKLQNGEKAKDVNGKIVQITHSKNGDYRKIGQYNCYHYEFSIVIGVSKPNFTDKELQEKMDKAKEVVNIDGKDYTRYECTQLQRQFEREIRKQKDIQILAKASGDMALVDKSQQKIRKLIDKYNEISKLSNLPTKVKRLQVAGYKKVAIRK